MIVQIKRQFYQFNRRQEGGRKKHGLEKTHSQTVACQAPLLMEFSRQEYWSGLPFPSPGDLPDPGIEPRSPALETDSLTFELPEKTLELRKKSYFN